MIMLFFFFRFKIIPPCHYQKSLLVYHLYVRDFTVSLRQTRTRQNNDLANNVRLKKEKTK